MPEEQHNAGENKKISLIITAVSRIIGVLGFAAIACNATQDGGLKFDILLFASFFTGFVFLFVALFGKYPWNGGERD